MRVLLNFFLLVFVLVVPLCSWAEQEALQQKKMAVFQADMIKLENSLNSLTTVVSTFTQTSPDGSISEGTFYLSRPGHLKWQYDPPNPVTIIVKGSLVTYYDAELDQVSHVSLDETLAGFLTKEHISFTEGVTITDYQKKEGKIYLTMIQEGKEEEGGVTLVFNNETLELKEMLVNDAVGNTTQVVFNSSVYGKPLDKKIFRLPAKTDKR